MWSKVVSKSWRAQTPQKSIFGAINFVPPQLFEYGIPVPDQACGVAQNSLKRDILQYWTSKHDMHTYGTLRAGFVDFSPQKFPHHLSNLIKFRFLVMFYAQWVNKMRSMKKILSNELYYRSVQQKLFSVEQLK